MLADAFRESKRTEAQGWLNHAYGLLWALEDWGFKFAQCAATVTADSSSLSALADDVGLPITLWNSDGDELVRVTPDEWNERYLGDTGTGKPETWRVLQSSTFPPTITVGPISNESDAVYTLYYERAFGRLNASGTFTAGALTDGADSPCLPAETHFAIVLWARTIGKGLRGDKTAIFESQLRDEAIDAMRRTYLATHRATSGQWGG